MVKYFLILVAVIAGSVQVEADDFDQGGFRLDGDCDYVLNETQTSFASPNYPEQYPESKTCTWKIETTVASGKIYLTFMDFYVDDSEDFLKVYDGEEMSDQNLIKSFTSVGIDAKTGTFLVISSGQKLTVQLKSSSQKSDNYRRRFSAQYTKGVDACTSDIGDLQTGYLGGVYYRPISNDDISCTYTLSALPGKKIAFSFDDHALKGKLTFTSGAQTATYRDDSKFVDFISETKSVSIVYKITNINSSVQVAFVHISDCGDSNIELTNKNKSAKLGLIGQIDNVLDCWWLVKAQNDKTVMSVFETSIAADEYLITVRDGGMKSSPLIGQFTGQQGELPSVLTTTEYMWIRFQTNQLTTAMSLITVTAQDYGKQFLTDFVTNFALNATTDVDKQYYRFSASSDYMTVSTDQVQLTFGICRLNNSARMTFYDGDSEAAPVITVFDSGCYPVFSSGQYLLLVVEGFKNHDFFSGNFSAVQAGCHGNLMSDAGVFSLESSRMNNTAECGWLVNPSGDGVVPMVLFDQINMDIGSNITVYYGFSTNGSKIAQITGGTSKSSSGILSNDPKGGPLFVQYVQNPAKNRNDAIFKAVYAKLGSCQRKMTALSSGELQSRNFPKNYPLNANCTNNLTVPNGKLIHLYYDTFKLHEKHYSRVIVSNGTTSTVIANYTGSVLPNDLVLNGSTVDVTFSSVLSNITDLTDNQGFNIKYTLLDCGGNLTNGSGNFSTPGYPKSVAKKTMCIWIITVPAITKKMATIVSLRFQPAKVKNKTSNYIMIRDGPSQRSDLIANTTTSNAKELTLLSRHNYLWVQYVFESTEKVKEGFPVKFSYSSYVCNATCDNKMCMHPDWMCDGIDQCGDNTDEQNCIPQASSSTGYSASAIILTFVLTFVGTVFLILGVPWIVRKYRKKKYSLMNEEAERI